MHAEHTMTVPKLTADDPPVGIRISKNGGGTPGNRYSGYWTWELTVAGDPVMGNDMLYTGTAVTHQEAAWICADFIACDLSESDPLHDRLTSFTEG